MTRLLILCALLVVPIQVWADGVLTPAANPPDNVLYDYRNSVQIQEEFITGATSSGTIGTLSWFLANGTTTLQASEANRPGILRRDTTSTISTVAYLLLSGSQTMFTTGGTWEVLWIARPNNFDSDTTLRVGASSSCTGTPSNGIYFEKTTADTNWYAVSRNGGVETGTRTDTGVTVSAVFRTFKIEHTATSVRFLIDGVVVATHAANIPAAGITGCAHIINATAVAKTIDYDYFQYRETGLVR